jgi:hypothetical protein
METAPVNVQVSPDLNQPRSFRLYAWYRQDDSIVPGRADPQDWNFSSPDGSVNGGVVSIQTFPTAGSTTAEVVVHKTGKPGVAGKSLLRLWADPGAAQNEGDVVNAPHQRGMPPSVVLIEQKDGSGSCRWGTPIAFVGTAAVGEQTVNPCSLSLFSADHGMVFQENRGGSQWPPTAWPTKGAAFSLQPGDRLKIPVTIFMIAPTPTNAPTSGTTSPQTMADIQNMAKEEVDLANAIYETNGLGIQIDVHKYQPLLGTPEELTIKVGADPYDCILPPTLESNPANPDYAYDSSRVSVYYVSRINFPAGQTGSGVRGIQCHFWYSGNALHEPAAKGPVVYVAYTRHSTTSLAHEIGHALGLNDEDGNLGTVNLMYNLAPDGPLGADARSRLRVGQVFRTNVWTDSWINTRWPPPLHRSCDVVEPCPELGLDVQ